MQLTPADRAGLIVTTNIVIKMMDRVDRIGFALS
jgi:hypothetical protein